MSKLTEGRDGFFRIIVLSGAVALVACSGSNDTSASKVKKVRAKYEAPVLAHGEGFAPSIAQAEVDALKGLPATASTPDVLDTARAVSGRFREDGRRTGEAICKEFQSARQSVSLKSVDSTEEIYEKRLVERSLVGTLAEAVFRVIPGIGDSRESVYAHLGLGQPTDPASPYAKGVSQGVISSDGMLAVASSQDAYDSFVDWLKYSDNLSAILGSLAREPTDVTTRCISESFTPPK